MSFARYSKLKYKFWKIKLFICSTDRVMIADFRNTGYIVCRDGICYVNKCKALKPKNVNFFWTSPFILREEMAQLIKEAI